MIHFGYLILNGELSITSTLGFPQLPRLEELSLAHNSLRALDGLTRPIKFPKLRYLDLRHNDIADYSSIVSLQHHKVRANRHYRLHLWMTIIELLCICSCRKLVAPDSTATPGTRRIASQPAV